MMTAHITLQKATQKDVSSNAQGPKSACRCVLVMGKSSTHRQMFEDSHSATKSKSERCLLFDLGVPSRCSRLNVQMIDIRAVEDGTQGCF